MEVKCVLIPISGRDHLLIRLVSNNMINVVVRDTREDFIQRVFIGMCNKSRQEKAFVTATLDECMDSITISANCSNSY